MRSNSATKRPKRRGAEWNGRSKSGFSQIPQVATAGLRKFNLGGPLIFLGLLYLPFLVNSIFTNTFTLTLSSFLELNTSLFKYSLLGQLAILGTLVKGLWRVAQVFSSSPNRAHSSLATPRFVRPSTLQAIVQAWCFPIGSSFKVHMFPCKAGNSFLGIHTCQTISILVNTS